jgi:class 3 adenylate cyclase/CheY-like chemotaxis protein
MFNWDAANQQLGSVAIEQEAKEPILVVDDEEANRNLLRGILSRDYDVILACDAKDALRKASENESIAAIVCDHRMPGMTGVEFFCELHKQQHTATRIILTGYAELQSIINAINNADVYRYLTKPVEAQLLRNTVSEAVGNFRMREDNKRLVGMVKGLLEDKDELYRVLEKSGKDMSGRRSSGSLDLGEARKIELAVMFVDIRGFTRFSASTPASRVIRTLQAIFKRIHTIIYEAGGLVDKHLGDGLMAVFGLSGSGGRQAGVQACRRIVEAFPRLVDGVNGAEFRGLKISVGLAAGEVVLGMIGTRHRSELAIIGEPANLANRLQEFSKVSLVSQRGRDVLGEFHSAMGIVDPELVEGMPGFKTVELNGLQVRDFSNVTRLAVISK